MDQLLAGFRPFRRRGLPPPAAPCSGRAFAWCRRRVAGCSVRFRPRRSGSTCDTPGCRDAWSSSSWPMPARLSLHSAPGCLIGGAALEGRFDAGTLLAWSFLLLSLVPLGIFAMWAQGVFMVGVSGILKMQLMAGASEIGSRRDAQSGCRPALRQGDRLAARSRALAVAGGFSRPDGHLRSVARTGDPGSTSRVVEVLVLLLFIVAVARGLASSISGCANGGRPRVCT